MSALSTALDDLTEQLGYVQCTFCTTILLVSVPCSSLLKVVTVKCGHCTALLSVRLAATSFLPLSLLTSLQDHLHHHQPSTEETQEVSGNADNILSCTGDNEDEKKEENENGTPPSNVGGAAINRPPEKRQRAASAYNHFIKEEIRRIKAGNQSITHKEAFSMASKNWALFPRVDDQCKEEDSGSCKKARNEDLN